MADLRIQLCGLDLRNPIVLASGPLSHDGDALIRAHQAGVGAVVTKTIRPQAARNPVPHIARWAGGLLNAEKWSDLPAQAWIDRELPRATDSGATVIASIGSEVKHVRALAQALASAGAAALEVCSYAASETVALVAAAAGAVRVPVLAKVSANWPDVASVAGACLRAGAAGITAIDSLGPALRIDIERRAPALGDGRGWLSGGSIFPIALRVVADIAQRTNAPIIGTGGIQSGDDCLEMLMAGAHAVGICSHLILVGLECVDRLVHALSARLDSLGYSCVGQATGAALPALERTRLQPLLAPEPAEQAQTVFRWDDVACTDCRRCVTVCPYRARTLPNAMDRRRCRTCGLCASVCPTGALRLERVSEEQAHAT